MKKKPNPQRSKKKSHKFQIPKSYRYKSWTIDTTKLPRSDDINLVFPYNKEIRSFDYSNFDPSTTNQKLTGEEMLQLSEEIEHRIGDLYSLNFTKPSAYYILTFILSLIFAVLLIVLINSSGIENKETDLFIKLFVFLVIFLIMVSVMAKIYKINEKRMKLRHRKFKEFEAKWNGRKGNEEKGMKIQFGFVGSWMKICLDEAEERRRKTTRRSMTSSSSNRSLRSSSRSDSGHSSKRKFGFEKKFLNKLEIIDEECSEVVQMEKMQEGNDKRFKKIKIENFDDIPNVGFLKSERGDLVTMRGLEDNDIMIDLTLSEIKKLQQSASSTTNQPKEMFEFVESRNIGPGMSAHSGLKLSEKIAKKNYQSAEGGIEEYKNRNKHLVMRSPSFTSSSKHFEGNSESDRKDGD